MMFKKAKTNQLIRESIMLAIDSVKDNISVSAKPEDNKIHAEAILILCLAYKQI